MSENLYPEHVRSVSRQLREQRWGQRGRIVWLYGLSGAGKSTLATQLEQQLLQAGKIVVLLDADIVRSGLNKGLGFSDADRWENLRRMGEMASLLARQGLIVLVTAITPQEKYRRKLREIAGEDLLLVSVEASYEECARRDPKGLYARAAQGQIKAFTGRDSSYEPSQSHDYQLETSTESVAASLDRLSSWLQDRL